MHILIVGPSTTTFRNYLKEHGHTHTKLIDRTQTKQPDAVMSERVVTDFSDKDTYIEAARGIHARQPIDAVMTTYENSILPSAVITEALGLPGLPVAAAEACTDKFHMRSLFSEAPQPISPDFAVVGSEAELLAFVDTHEFPLILKPANLAKSLLVTKNHDRDELLSNYRKAVRTMPDIYRKYSPHRMPKLIIEEFMSGSIHSVDAFVDKDGVPHILDAIVDYQTGYDVGYDDNFHYSRLLPSALSKEQQERMREIASLGCRALGMRSSAAHIEVIMTDNGPRIVEIGARNGGYRERMHRLANGFDVIDAALQIALGKVPDTTISRHESCAVIELFPMKHGKFERLSGEAEARTLPSFVQCNIKVKPGQEVGKSSDGYKMCAMMMLHNKDAVQFAHDLAWVNANVKVVTS